ncbi:MAG: SLATT domain-containing protein [Bacteroidota bacterium]|nr:SLATT domain-containing protein [Bacteroidota bacterium]
MKMIIAYFKKLKRARNIKKAKNKIPPYLKKDFGVELNYKLWVTKGARFEASARCNKLDSLSAKTVGYLSAYLIIINMLNVYQIPLYVKIPENYLAFITTALSILILIFSQFEYAKNYKIQSERFHQCAIEISELYNRLRMVKTFASITNKEEEIEKISQQYDLLLKRYENHSPIDTLIFTTTKPGYFELSSIRCLVIKAKGYLITSVKYHFFIYMPIIAMIYFQLSKH